MRLPVSPAHRRDPTAGMLGNAARDPALPLADVIDAALGAGEALIRIGVGVVLRRTPWSAPTAQSTAGRRVTRSDEHPGSSTTTELGALTDELLDAHADTVWLAASRPDDLRWAAHLEYLRALQRRGREALARCSSEVSG